MIRRRGLLNLFLLVLVSWVGFQAYSLLFPGSGGPGALSEEPKKISMVPVPPPPRIMEPEKAYEDVIEKNLFRSERKRWRPPEAPPSPSTPSPLPPPPPPPPSPPPITLQGIIVTGERKVALLNCHQKGAPKQITVRAKVGDEVAGTRVHAIEEGRVILQWNQKPIVLHVHMQDGQKNTNKPMPENIPLLLTEEEMARMQIELKAKPKKAMPPSSQASIPGSQPPAAEKGKDKLREEASKPSPPAKMEKPKVPAKPTKIRQPPARPSHPSAPRRRFPHSIFAPSR